MPEPQVTPQAPQLPFTLRSTHPELQQAADGAVPHDFPHPPQLLMSVVVFVSQPVDTLPLQLAKPPLQFRTHVPVAQLALSFADPHCVPQPPQLLRV